MVAIGHKLSQTVSNVPNVPNVPNFLNFLNVQNVPNCRNVPHGRNVPKVSIVLKAPYVPDIPNIPNVPNVLNVSIGPNVPNVAKSHKSRRPNFTVAKKVTVVSSYSYNCKSILGHCLRRFPNINPTLGFNVLFQVYFASRCHTCQQTRDDQPMLG